VKTQPRKIEFGAGSNDDEVIFVGPQKEKAYHRRNRIASMDAVMRLFFSAKIPKNSYL